MQAITESTFVRQMWADMRTMSINECLCALAALKRFHVLRKELDKELQRVEELKRLGLLPESKHREGRALGLLMAKNDIQDLTLELRKTLHRETSKETQEPLHGNSEAGQPWQ